MSNTKKFKPQPYYNVAVLSEIEDDMVEEQNPDNRSNSDQNSAETGTRTQNDTATSDKSDSEATYEKRWKDLKKHYDTQVTTLRNQIADLEQAKKANAFNPPKTAEDIEKFRQKYPDFYDVMLSVAYEQAANSGDVAASRIRSLEEKLSMAEQERAFAEIEKAHPDYIKVVNTKDFIEWLDTQAPAIQSWVKENSTDASTFIRALDLYKHDAGITRQTPNRDSSADKRNVGNSAADAVDVKGSSVNVGGTNKRIWSPSEIAKMSSKEFEKYEAELDEAWAEGRVQ